MSDCEHKSFRQASVGYPMDDVHYIRCNGCDADEHELLSDVIDQRDAAEKRAADAEAEVERQKAAVERLLTESVGNCATCLQRHGQCQGFAQIGSSTSESFDACRERIRSWAYGELTATGGSND